MGQEGQEGASPWPLRKLKGVCLEPAQRMAAGVAGRRACEAPRKEFGFLLRPLRVARLPVT